MDITNAILKIFGIYEEWVDEVDESIEYESYNLFFFLLLRNKAEEAWKMYFPDGGKDVDVR